MKKTVAMMMVVMALACLAIVGCSSSGRSSSASASNPSASDSQATAQIESAESGEGNEPVSQEPTGDVVAVPDFTDRNAATVAIQALELELIPVFKSDSGKAVINPLNWRVVDQDPFPGEMVEKNSVVVIKVTKDDSGGDAASDGESVAIVPFVVGMNADNAEKQLEDAGLKANIESDNGKMVLRKKNWRVVSQSPEEGTATTKGAEVTLIVSKSD